MGLDPEFPGFESGDECPLCVESLFNGTTPKYVEVDVFDLELCPGAPPLELNGTFLLTQTAPCQWLGGPPGVGMVWILNIGQSLFTIVSGPVFFFSGVVAASCIDAFVNLIVNCNPPFQMGKNGYATLWWGPTIGP